MSYMPSVFSISEIAWGRALHPEHWTLLSSFTLRELAILQNMFASQVNPWYYVHTLLGHECCKILAKVGDSPSILQTLPVEFNIKFSISVLALVLNVLGISPEFLHLHGIAARPF